MRKLSNDERKIYQKIVRQHNFVMKKNIDYQNLDSELDKFKKSPTFYRYLKLIANYNYNIFHPNRYYPNKYTTTKTKFKQNHDRYRELEKRKTTLQRDKTIFTHQKSNCTIFFEKNNIPKNHHKLAIYIKKNTNTKLSTNKIEKILDEILKRGMGAYFSSGSRPGQTPESWGRARVYCRVRDILLGNIPKSDRDLLDSFMKKN